MSKLGTVEIFSIFPEHDERLGFQSQGSQNQLRQVPRRLSMGITGRPKHFLSSR